MKNRKPKFLQLGKSRDSSVRYVKILMCEGGKKSKDNTALQVQAKVSWILFWDHSFPCHFHNDNYWLVRMFVVEGDWIRYFGEGGLLSASIKL